MRNIRFIFIGILLFLVMGGVAMAANSDYQISRWVTSSGGGIRTSEHYMTEDVIGQGATGASQSQHFLLEGGFFATAQQPPVPPPPPVRVGGESYPINKAAVIAPWLALAAAIIAGAIIFMRRRRAQS